MRARLRRVFVVRPFEDIEVCLNRILSPSLTFGPIFTNLKRPITHDKSINGTRMGHEALPMESSWSKQSNLRDLQYAGTAISLPQRGTHCFASTSEERYDIEIILV